MRALDRVAILNLALVMTHQVDAAFWKEWEMFRLPGGIQFFNVFNLCAFALLLYCFAAMARRMPFGFRGSLVIATLSGVVLPIHAAFAAAGFTQFHLPLSIAIIVSTFLVSLWQFALTLRARQEFQGRL